MSDLDVRLASLNPVQVHDLHHTASGVAATRLLSRILRQEPVALPPDHPRRTVRHHWAGVAAVGAAVTAAMLMVIVPASRQALRGDHALPAFGHGPSVGVARSALELVDYAARSAALVPEFTPAPQDWEYSEKFYGSSTSAGAAGTGDERTWQQVGFPRFAGSWNHGALTFGTGEGSWARLTGWPGPNWTTMYEYLASLPAKPAALRQIILANNHHSPPAAFGAVAGLLADFPVSARFQAELYAVLVSLPGVGFIAHTSDAARRIGAGLYMVYDSNTIAEVLVDPRTYVYMGGLEGTVAGYSPDGTSHARPHLTAITATVAVLSSGIVARPGQTP